MKFLRLRKAESNLAVPIAIVVAGILVAGAVFYTNQNKASTTANVEQTQDNYKYQKYVNVAKDIGLDADKFKACMDKFDTAEIKKDLADAQKYGASGTPTFFIGLKKDNGEVEAIKLVGAQPFDRFKPVIDALVDTKDINKAIEALPDDMKVDQSGKPVDIKTVTVSIDDDAIKGNKDSDVYVVEFSDFECPFCKRYSTTTYKQITDEYVKAGKIAYVFRDLPLSFHDPIATEEAVAANCAKAQGGDEAYYAYHDKLYELTRSNKQGIPE